MASPSTTDTLKKEKKEESFLDKLGTIGRKKKIKEVEEVAEEGRNAIESPTNPTLPVLDPQAYLLNENEERTMLDPACREDPRLQELIKLLVNWVNDELAAYRIIVKNLEEDMFDGQIFQKLVEKLAETRMEVPEVTQSEVGQRQKLHVILDTINTMLQQPTSWHHRKWSVESIHSKNLVAILHLLVALARYFRAPIRLPENVSVAVLVVQKRGGLLQTRKVNLMELHLRALPIL